MLHLVSSFSLNRSLLVAYAYESLLNQLIAMIFTNIYVNFIFSRWFMLFSSSVALKQFLKFSNLSFLLMTYFFVPFAFLSSLLLCHLLSNYKFLPLIQKICHDFSTQLIFHESIHFFIFSFRQ